MIHVRRKNARAQRGQSMVEFALVLPIVLLLIFGLLEFGRVIQGQLTAGHCANELARFGVVQPGNEAQVTQAIQAYAISPTNPVCPPFDLSASGTVAITIEVNYPVGMGVGDALVVDVTYPIEIVVPGIKQLMASAGLDPYPAHGTATLQME